MLVRLEDVGIECTTFRRESDYADARHPDRLQHASLAFSLGLAAGVATRSPGAAAGSAIALGLAKELADRRHVGFDAGDLIADALGAAAAALAVSGLSR